MKLRGADEIAQPGEAMVGNGTDGHSDPFAALDFDAPYLVERLVKHGTAASPQEALALFTEVKRYLVLATTDRSRLWDMYSLRVDEAWHQFILYTAQYSEFCRRFFGHYVHHTPNNAPGSAAHATVPPASFAQFCDRYRELFGVLPPDVWYDELSITPASRLRNDLAGKLTLRRQDDVIELLSESGDVLFSINDLAEDALAFIVEKRAFYVRELPGELDDEEKVGLAGALVEGGILRVAG
jgi:hypothetical protein